MLRVWRLQSRDQPADPNTLKEGFSEVKTWDQKEPCWLSCFEVTVLVRNLT